MLMYYSTSFFFFVSTFLKIVLDNDFRRAKIAGLLAASKEIVTTLRAALGVGNTDLMKVTS